MMNAMKVFPELFVWTEIFGKSIINSPCLNIWFPSFGKPLSKTDNNNKKAPLKRKLGESGRETV